MKAIAPGLGLRGHDTGNGTAEFRIVVLGGDFRLCNRLQSWIDDDNAKNRILIVCSVQLVSGAAEVLSVNKDLLARLGVLSGRVGKTHQSLGTRSLEQELGKIAVENRQLGN